MKILCRCGHNISNSMYPSPSNACFLIEMAQDSLEAEFGDVAQKAIDSYSENKLVEFTNGYFGSDYVSDPQILEVLADIRTKIENGVLKVGSECELCGRIYLQTQNGVAEYICYEPMEAGCHRIFST